VKFKSRRRQALHSKGMDEVWLHFFLKLKLLHYLFARSSLIGADWLVFALKKGLLGYGHGRAPFVLQMSKSVAVDVGVEDLGSEACLHQLVWITKRNLNYDLEHASCIGTVRRSHNNRLPTMHIILAQRSHAA
jgi:hypothetical protein